MIILGFFLLVYFFNLEIFKVILINGFNLIWVLFLYLFLFLLYFLIYNLIVVLEDFVLERWKMIFDLFLNLMYNF